MLREAWGSSTTARAACVPDRRRKFVDNTDRGNKPDHADGDPRPAAVTFVTTEHFTLQGARSSTISESNRPGERVPWRGIRRPDRPRARRHRRQGRRGVLRVRAHSPAHPGLRGAGDIRQMGHSQARWQPAREGQAPGQGSASLEAKRACLRAHKVRASLPGPASTCNRTTLTTPRSCACVSARGPRPRPSSADR